MDSTSRPNQFAGPRRSSFAAPSLSWWRTSAVVTATVACCLFATPIIAETPSEATGNRLIHSANPYLLLHAHNPVDWYPWGVEAIAKAKKENKPIFLSVGYSTCYW